MSFGLAGGGFSERLSLEVAWAWLDARPAPLAAEDAPLAESAGRVLAEAIYFSGDRPPIALALIDGYAVQAESALGASAYNPLPLTLSSEGAAVAPGAASPVRAGTAAPEGADTVLPLSFGEVLGGMLHVCEAAPRGAGLARRGEAAAAGDLALPAGQFLGSAQLALAASIGLTHLKLVRRPSVALWIAGAKPPARESLAPALSALIARDGGTAQLVASDDAPPPGADVLLMAGRSGWGADDDALTRLRSWGGEIAHHGLALTPGGSAGLGVLGEAPVLLLPGDPYAALATYEALAGRLIRRFAGRPAAFAGPTRRLKLARKIASPVGVAEFALVACEAEVAWPMTPSPSDGLATLARADGFVLISAGQEGFGEGAEVEVVMLRSGGWE